MTNIRYVCCMVVNVMLRILVYLSKVIISLFLIVRFMAVKEAVYLTHGLSPL